MRKILGILICLSIFYNVEAQQTRLAADFTNVSTSKGAITNILDSYNRETPVNGVSSTRISKPKITTVRTLGGGVTKIAGKAVLVNGKRTAFVDYDSFKWSQARGFYNDFTALDSQIRNATANGKQLDLLVLNNPSWAFQLDDNGNKPSGGYIVSTYGNAQPPRQLWRWKTHIRELLNHIKQEFPTIAQNIKYGIGREMGTSGHWVDGKDSFFEFYKQTSQVVRSTIMNAKVGSHFRWNTSAPVDGESTAWGPDFITYCKDTPNVSADFVGISYYAKEGDRAKTNVNVFYRDDIKPFRDAQPTNGPEIEIHEFSLLKDLNAAGDEITDPTKDRNGSFLVSVFKMLTENNIKKLVLWSDGNQYGPAYNLLENLEGRAYYTNSNSDHYGNPGKYAGRDFIDAIFSKGGPDNYRITAYYYSSNLTNPQPRSTRIVATINAPAGKSFELIRKIYNKATNELIISNPISIQTESIGVSNKSNLAFTYTLSPNSYEEYEIQNLNSVPNAAGTYNGVISIPGVIEAENYNLGGQGVSYNDTTPGNNGNAYRTTDDVDIQTNTNNTRTNVGWMDTGEWLEYTINIPTTGNYNFEMTYAANSTGGAIGAEFADDGVNLFSNFSLVQANGWTVYNTNTKYNVFLNAGVRVLRIKVENGGFNLDKIRIFRPWNAQKSTDKTVKTELEDKELVVYPNPSKSGKFILSKSSVWAVYNTIGIKVLEGKGTQVDLSKFTTGIYLLKSNNKTKKIFFSN